MAAGKSVTDVLYQMKMDGFAVDEETQKDTWGFDHENQLPGL